jgi:ABC-type multidrug transport system permease subunit
MKTNKQYYLPGNITNKTLFYIRTFIIVIFNYTTVDFLNLYTSQQKKRYKDFFFQIYFYVKPKTIVYYHLRQCLCETRLSSQNKQQHPVP